MSVKYYDSEFEDSEFGEVYVRYNVRSRNIIFRIIDGQLWITSSPHLSDSVIKNAIGDKREKLRELFQRTRTSVPEHIIDETFKITTPAFCFSVVCNREKEFRLHRVFQPQTDPLYVGMPDCAVVQLECPYQTDFDNEQRQRWLRKVVEAALIKEVKPYLQYMLNQMSAKSGLAYEQFMVGRGKTRWGWCSRLSGARKKLSQTERVIEIGPYTQEEYFPHKICLNSFTALLPLHLAQYICLHELTHTRHADHSDDFHSTLDMLTRTILGVSAKECEWEMRKCRTDINCFAK
ncbi:MAG: DUF45 domain-containing protein [Paludibacteraceae bacterium]|nr:DUF45 domain-containing protein [Paludibacteraceae bacterium]